MPSKLVDRLELTVVLLVWATLLTLLWFASYEP